MGRSHALFLFISLLFGGHWVLIQATCVLESDFGFSINCAFKKSGLLRVRNLGGIKAHVGLGFSIGDDNGFKESYKPDENLRRSAPALPPFKPLPEPGEATSTSSSTPPAPTPSPAPAYTVQQKRLPANASAVMNAPREYYPAGYDKNFDDHFASRVQLPDTSFRCVHQKHFPGLYADEDLGCMVFHVCALTDDGLVMKSFLCPESTLFDQTILKCNWWFYVDCKNSRRLYDSNLPVSESYQLMKALAFFSSYKRPAPATASAASEASQPDANEANA